MIVTDSEIITKGYPLYNGYGDIIGYHEGQTVITKEAFIEAYNKWIKNIEERDEK